MIRDATRTVSVPGRRRLADVPQPGVRGAHEPPRQLDIVLRPDGTGGYEELVRTATPERLVGTAIVVPVASAEMILQSKTAADPPKDHAMLDRMRDILNPLSARDGLDPHDRSRSRGGPNHLSDSAAAVRRRQLDGITADV